MIIVDTNILLYAYVPRLEQHRVAAQWMEETLSSGGNSIGIIWQVATAFLRLSTNKRIFESPLEIAMAKSYLDEIFAHPLVSQVGPTERHWNIYSSILIEQRLAGDIVMDAHIAAVAIEHNAIVATTDKHFRQFTGYVKVIYPLSIK